MLTPFEILNSTSRKKKKEIKKAQNYPWTWTIEKKSIYIYIIKNFDNRTYEQI